MRIIEGNRGVIERFIEGHLPAGAVRQEAYKFFDEYRSRGAINDEELIYELIKHLWVTGMIKDAKLLLHAAGAMKTSDSGGREVIDEMLSVTPEDIRVGWNGTDRPEFTDWNGSKVCVERETTNQIDDPDKASVTDGTSWSNHATVSNSGTGNAFLDHDCQIITTVEEGESSSSRTDQVIGTWTSGPETFYAIIENGDTINGQIGLTLRNMDTGHNAGITLNWDTGITTVDNLSTGAGVTVTNHGAVKLMESGPNSGPVYLVYITATGVEGDSRRVTIYTFRQDPGRETSFYCHFTQHEELPYWTLPVDGTRLAPTVTIEDALPETGTVGQVLDIVRDGDANTTIFDTGGTLLTDRSIFLFRSNNDNFRLDIFGNTYEAARGFTMNVNERTQFAYLVTYSASALKVFFLTPSGDIIERNNSISVTDTSRKNITFGAVSSFHFENIWHKDNIVRVNASDDEIKAFFEFLTLGTSMQMTADEMEIVS